MALPNVTVGIPTYNRSGLLREAIESVLAQRYGDLEVIVFDDGSTDDTAEVVAGYRAADRRVSYVRNPVNLGHPRNVTQVLSAGRGRYLGLLFDDDVMFPDHLERLVSLLDDHPAAAAAHSAYELWAGDGTRVAHILADTERPGVVEEDPTTFLPRLIREAPRVWVAAALMRRDRVCHLDFRASDEPATDVMFWMRVALEGTIVYDPHPTACLRVTEGYSSENDFLAIDETGRYKPTFGTVRAYQSVFSQFRAQNRHRLPLALRARLVLSEARTRHGLLQAVVRRRSPGLRQVAAAKPLLREAIAIDPTVVVDPLFVGRLARERLTPASLTR